MVPKSKILIVGIGSAVLGDSGIGLRLVDDLHQDLGETDYDYQSIFKGGWEMLEVYEGYRNVVIIDSIVTGKFECGHIHFMNEGSYMETRNLSSSHDLDFKETLLFGRELGLRLPENIEIIAVEILDDLVIRDELSTELNNCYRQVYLSVLNYIREKMKDTLMVIRKEKENEHEKV
jgi:hydrogenase maturation protease